ncbi:hypothetical protein GT037_007244 [Alternaria burnsii]|uniref:Uncharacterized protein n=1 Tax=Alternaria burnsii TaxID=1187904 RepID=A0A8H7AZL6_9PLEO|nr:uncharacterized protein GT037_007244 [Alternaria burnsii]KAF7674484.1 hypothetical protein GT037_007244 [Alternaria burnsii]
MAYLVFEQISGIDHLFKSQHEAMRCIEQCVSESQGMRSVLTQSGKILYAARYSHQCVNEQCRLFIPKSCVGNDHLYDATMIEFIAIAGAATSATAWVYELKFHDFLDLPPELRLNVCTHSLSMVARCGCGTNTDSIGMIRTRYRIEITTKTCNHNLTKIMDVYQFLFYLWLLFADVAIAIAIAIAIANIPIEIDVASSDTIQRGIHHGLSQHISAVAYKERMMNTYFGLETAFTTDQMMAILAPLHPTQSQELLLETLVRCNGSIEQAKEVIAEEAHANAPRVCVDLTLSSPVIKPENIDNS